MTTTRAVKDKKNQNVENKPWKKVFSTGSLGHNNEVNHARRNGKIKKTRECN